MPEQSNVNDEMTKLAKFAVNTAKEKFSCTLDLSEKTLPALDSLLDQAYSRFSDLAKQGKLRDESVRYTAKVWGSYLGEVIRWNLGGQWLQKQDYSVIMLNDREVAPIEYVYRRITQGPEYELIQYYAVASSYNDLPIQIEPQLETSSIHSEMAGQEQSSPRSRSGDRSGYRAFYPAILKYAAVQWEQEIKRASSPENVSWLKSLAEDSQRVVAGVDILSWPNEKELELVQYWTEAICKDKVAYGRKLRGQDIEVLKDMGENRDILFRAIPERRLNASRNWKLPFDAIDPDLGEDDFSVFDVVLDKMHDFVERGHNWFGVGEWGIANRNYLNALTLALANNNLMAIELVVRFVVDTYVASKAVYFACNLANEFLQSTFYGGNFRRLVDVGVFGNLLDIHESVVVGLALKDQWHDARQWWQGLLSKLGETLPTDIDRWNVVQLLTDVYTFRKDQISLQQLDVTKTRLAKEISQWQYITFIVKMGGGDERLRSLFADVNKMIGPKLQYFGFEYSDLHMNEKWGSYEEADWTEFFGTLVYERDGSNGEKLRIAITATNDDLTSFDISDIGVAALRVSHNGTIHKLPKCKFGSESARKEGVFAVHMSQLEVPENLWKYDGLEGMDARTACRYTDTILLPRLFKKLGRLGHLSKPDYLPGSYEEFTEALLQLEIERNDKEIQDEIDGFWEEFGFYIDHDE